MWRDAPLLPESASTLAPEIDAIYWSLVAVSGFFATLICCLVLGFAVRYRRRPGVRAQQIEGSIPLEIVWSAIPLVIALGSFAWGAEVFLRASRPPRDAMDVTVTGKQWMWRLQHPEGQREINALHVPVGQKVRLTMISEDVIHSFFVPAFRMKRDVVPGRYSVAWFEATREGRYHLFCAEYCGTKHSEMRGTVHVMEPAAYERWLADAPSGATPVEAGRLLFTSLRCDTCHSATSGARGPDLAGRFGGAARIEGGRSVTFDEGHVRESILEPRTKVTAGYEPVMPTYEGQVSEEQILQIIAYLKSIAAPAEAEGGGE